MVHLVAPSGRRYLAQQPRACGITPGCCGIRPALYLAEIEQARYCVREVTMGFAAVPAGRSEHAFDVEQDARLRRGNLRMEIQPPCVRFHLTPLITKE
jgi:hypothetical protein